MLIDKNRLRKKSDIDIVFNKGKFVPGELANLKYWKISSEAFPKRGYDESDLKVTVVVGKKVAKSAVKRNKLKRQFREVLRLEIKQNKLKTGYFILIMVKPEAFDSKFDDIKSSVEASFRKAGLNG